MPLKDLRGRGVGKKVTGWDGKILRELEGLPGPSRLWVNGRAWFAGHLLSDSRNLQGLRRAGGRIVPTTARIIAYWYCMSMITYKGFGF